MEPRVSDWLIKSVEICMNGASTTDEDLRVKLAVQADDYDTFSEKEKADLLQLFRQNFEDQDIVYICSYFARYLVREELMQLMFSSMQSMENEPWLSVMLHLQLDAYVKGYFEEKKRYNKKTVQALKDEMKVHLPYIPFEQRNKKRVVIVTEQMLALQHAPTKQVFEYAYVMKKMGYEVLFFLCPCDNYKIVHAWQNPLVMDVDERFVNKKWERVFRGETFEGYQVSLTDGYLKDYSMMMEFIHAWNPLFVYAIGISNPIADVAGSFTDVVSHKFGIGLPATEASVLIETGMSQTGVFQNDEGRLVVRPPEPRVSFFPALREYTREEFRLPEDRFLVAIVGNRLHREIDEQFIRVLQRIQERNDRITFVLIGLHLDEIPLIDSAGLNLVKLGYCDDLMGVMKILDLYLNPFRMGGGYSGGIALCSGTPVVTLPDCDVAMNVTENFVVKDQNQMIETVLRYSEDDAFRKKMQIKARLFMNDHSLENYFNDLSEQIRVLVTAITEYRGGSDNI